MAVQRAHEDDASHTRGVETIETVVRVPPSTLVRAAAVPVLSGRFQLSSSLGRGGMGAVYRARDTMLDEDVALKVLDGPLDDYLLSRLRQEVKLARRVTHPNVVRTYDMGIHEHTPFITMELVEGESLASLISREGPLPLARFYGVARAVSAAIAAAHAASVLHLDLKPANVLVGDDGRIAVSDFGVACLAGTGASAIAGTPAFMAPEQRAGAPVDVRADVYAMGLLFFVALTGRLPQGTASAPDPVLPQEVAFLVFRCLAEDPALRYASAADVLADLNRIAPAFESNRAIATSPRAPELVRQPAASRVPGAIADAVAMERYTLARIAYHKYWPDHVREAVGHLDVAIQRCPDNATLLAAGALALLRLGFVSGEAVLERARGWIDRASSIDPELPHVQLARATLAMSQGDEAGAMEPLRFALSRAPWLGEAHARLGDVLAEIGVVDRAVAELQMAHDLDPLGEEPVARRAFLHAVLGDIATCDRLLGSRCASDGNLNMYSWRRARALLVAPTPERIARMRADLASLDFQFKYVLETVMQMIETREIPELLLAVLVQMTTPSESPRRTWFYTAPFVDALAHAGRPEEAMTWLEHADRHGLLDLVWLDRATTLDGLRGMPRFAAVRANVASRAERVRRAAIAAGLV